MSHNDIECTDSVLSHPEVGNDHPDEWNTPLLAVAARKAFPNYTPAPPVIEHGRVSHLVTVDGRR
ncbi:hypothetical protein [Nocardia nepalensis]|uniref:hypothetical protein n=1 Tax=Nocardia nepalensis TaxID=3375448 RepID=UPI003B679343